MTRGRSNARARGRTGMPRWRRRVGALAVALAVAAIVLAVSSPAGMAQTTTCQPQVGAQGAAPFTVWYCAGDTTGQQAAVTVARLLDQVWPVMTQPEPDGLGPPLAPEANGGRFSVYVTAPTAEVVLGECPDLCFSVGDNFGQAVPMPPFIVSRSGAERSSAALILNEGIGVNDATVIHDALPISPLWNSGVPGQPRHAAVPEG